ncbi:hypothetical protein Q2T41_14325 [Maribacter confluentis]|uniref:Uncharacterized protein n=1 Tax=Maribacter confluentis TaxID=1656093 RepID=A0ABT8RSH6_9FLAO|nr:hypothetical protein [Maribacter confluentis]MDO1513833.1 hypothetical protein [Maribacter confluentis]
MYNKSYLHEMNFTIRNVLVILIVTNKMQYLIHFQIPMIILLAILFS